MKINPKAILHKKKRRALNPKRYEAVKDEVKKLIDNRFIQKLIYLKWVSNPILIKIYNGKFFEVGVKSHPNKEAQ